MKKLILMIMIVLCSTVGYSQMIDFKPLRFTPIDRGTEPVLGTDFSTRDNKRLQEREPREVNRSTVEDRQFIGATKNFVVYGNNSTKNVQVISNGYMINYTNIDPKKSYNTQLIKSGTNTYISYTSDYLGNMKTETFIIE